MLPEACSGKKLKPTLIKWSVVGVIGIILLAIGSLILLWLEDSGYLTEFITWVGSTGIWGQLVLGFLLAVMNFPFTFGWMIVAMSCGFLYGFFVGLLVVIIGTTVGFFFAFIFLRRFLRKPAMMYIEKKGGYVARAIMYELKNHQVKVSLMVRAGPVPPGLQNAILAVSPMSLWLYMLTSIPGFLVKEIPYVYIGSSLVELADAVGSSSSSSLSTSDIVLGVLGFFAVVGMFIFIIWVSRKAMRDAKKLKLKEELARQYDASESSANEAEDVSHFLSKKLENDPYQASDPILNLLGLGYDGNDSEDSFFSSDEEDNEERKNINSTAGKA